MVEMGAQWYTWVFKGGDIWVMIGWVYKGTTKVPMK